MIRVFKNNRPESFLTLPVVCLAFYMAGTAIGSRPFQEGQDLFNLVVKLAMDIPMLESFLAASLVVAGAFLLNRVVTNFEFDGRNTTLPGLIYILFSVYHVTEFSLHPVLISNLFLIAAFGHVLATNRKGPIHALALNTGLWLGLAGLFTFSYVVFLPALWLGITQFRPFAWREWLIVLIGVTLPWMLILTLYFLFDLSFAGVSGQVEEFFRFRYVASSWLLYLITLILVIWMAVVTFLHYANRNLRSKKNIRVLLIFFATALAIFATGQNTSPFYILAPLLATLFSNFLVRVKPLYADLALLSLAAALVQNTLLPYLS